MASSPKTSPDPVPFKQPAQQSAAAGPQPVEPAQPPKPAEPAVRGPRVAPPARHARLRMRHVLVGLSFLLLVIGPTAAAGWYLWMRAHDQYASTVGFSVRHEDTSSAIELLGGISSLSGSSSSDTDILYEYLQSQKLISEMDREIGLSEIWSRPGTSWTDPDSDPVFAFDGTGSVEDLMDYWEKMVRISYDSGAGLIEVRVLAFTSEDAHRIAQQLFDKSSDMINTLSTIAREDSVRYAREELEVAEERLRDARAALTEFRNRNQMVDPAADGEAQMELLAQLQGQLAEALIEVDLLQDSTREGDPRLTQAQRRVEVIEMRIAAERSKLGLGGLDEDNEVMAEIVGDYERLAVDREIAEETYATALISYDSALSEARRKSRYLAAYVEPTFAETPRYPQRVTILSLVALFLFLSWAIAVLVAWSVKDRR